MTMALAHHHPVDPISDHEHGWETESTHPTSAGLVRYVRCAGCGARRIDVGPIATVPPLAASVVLPSPPHAGGMMEHVHARSRTSTPPTRTS